MSNEMRLIKSRLERHGLQVHNISVDAVSVGRQRWYIVVTLITDDDVEDTDFMIDTALGKFCSIIEMTRRERTSKTLCLLAVDVKRFKMIVQYEELSKRLYLQVPGELASSSQSKPE